MIFKGKPKQLVRFQSKNLRNGRKTGIRFDENGLYDTENPRLIKALSRRFEVVANEKEKPKKEVAEKGFTEKELRELAKKKKIKSWHVKSVETLKEELGVD